MQSSKPVMGCDIKVGLPPTMLPPIIPPPVAAVVVGAVAVVVVVVVVGLEVVVAGVVLTVAVVETGVVLVVAGALEVWGAADVTGALVVGVVDPAAWVLEHPANIAKTVISEMSNKELVFMCCFSFLQITLA